jgi:uncharacterized protein GlcG (DUF336 family)
MFEKQVLGLREAQVAVDAILEEASKTPERPVAVAVVDSDREIICMMRMDGATPMYNYMALKKAQTAALYRRDTRALGEWLRTLNFDTSDFNPEATRVAGGVYIVKPEGESSAKKIGFGGIGVSGRPDPEADEALAIIGLKALQKALWG